MNFIFSWQEQYFTHSLRSFVKYCFCHSKIKFISSPPCNILYVFEVHIAKISVTSPIVVNMPTRELLAGQTKSSFV